MPTGVYPRTEEHKKKIGLFFKGRRLPENQKKKISEALKGNKNGVGNKSKAGIEPWNKGISLPEEIRLKISKTLKNNIPWNKGKVGKRVEYTPGLTEDLREFIRKRDGRTCQKCGITEKQLGQKLDTHHKDHAGDNHNPKNLISLCRSCHMKIRRKINFVV